MIKDTKIEVRLSTDEKIMVEKAAAKALLKTSTWARQQLLQQATINLANPAQKLLAS